MTYRLDINGFLMYNRHGKSLNSLFKQDDLTAMLDTLKIEKRKTIRQQISDYLREMILTGELAAGSKLPATMLLAKKWNTQAANIHAALAPLVAEGLLTRKKGVGTIVNAKPHRLEVIAVYVKQGLRAPASFFSRLLLENIERVLLSEGIECRFIFENFENSGFDQLLKMAKSRKIQGVITQAIDHALLSQLKKLPVPFSCLTESRIKNSVQYNPDDLIEKVIEAVRGQGGKRLGLICSSPDNTKPEDSAQIERHGFYIKMFEAIQKSGLENRPEWNFIKSNDFLKNSKYTHYAYECFSNMWKLKEKPDSLFVYTDDLVTGTLLAIAANRVLVPEQLRLIMHRNSGNDILCPHPCYFIENDIDEMARSLVKQIQLQFSGKNIEKIKYGYRLVKNM